MKFYEIAVSTFINLDKITEISYNEEVRSGQVILHKEAISIHFENHKESYDKHSVGNVKQTFEKLKKVLLEK
jgi:hypothetical protein